MGQLVCCVQWGQKDPASPIRWKTRTNHRRCLWPPHMCWFTHVLHPNINAPAHDSMFPGMDFRKLWGALFGKLCADPTTWLFSLVQLLWNCILTGCNLSCYPLSKVSFLSSFLTDIRVMSTLLFSHKISSICICCGSHTGFLVRREEKWRTVGSAGDGDQTPCAVKTVERGLWEQGKFSLAIFKPIRSLYVCALICAHVCIQCQRLVLECLPQSLSTWFLKRRSLTGARVAGPARLADELAQWSSCLCPAVTEWQGHAAAPSF